MTPFPKPDPPVACSLSASEMAARGDELRELSRRALVGRARTSGGVRLEFAHSEATEAAVRDLVRRERECCPFLTFELGVDAGRLTVEVSGPGDAQPLLDAVYEQAAAAEPRTGRQPVGT